MRFSSHIPAPLRRAPRGGGIFNLIALIATVVLTGGIGLGILGLIDASSCTVNVFWGCGSSGGGGTTIGGSTLCVSSPNSCGQRNVGTLQQSNDPAVSPVCDAGYTYAATQDEGGSITGYRCQQCDEGGCQYSNPTCANGDQFDSSSGQCLKSTCSATPPSDASCTKPCTSPANACGQTTTGVIVNGSCNATAPSNASCPKPSIGSFGASPATIGPAGSGTNGGKTTLSWKTTNTTSCSIKGDNGFSYTGNSNGSVAVTGLTQTTVFTLTCQDGAGGLATSKSAKVIIDPFYVEK